MNREFLLNAAFLVLVNLLIISGLLILASPQLSLRGYCSQWFDGARNFLFSLWMSVKTLGGTLE